MFEEQLRHLVGLPTISPFVGTNRPWPVNILLTRCATNPQGWQEFLGLGLANLGTSGPFQREVFHHNLAFSAEAFLRRFHQMSGPVTAINGRLRLKTQARIRVGSPPISPV